MGIYSEAALYWKARSYLQDKKDSQRCCYTHAYTISAGWVRPAFYILLPFYFAIIDAEGLETIYMQCFSAECQEVCLVKMIKDPKYCMSGRARGRCEYMCVCVCVARCVTVEQGRIMLALFSSHWHSAKPTTAWRWMRTNTCAHTHTPLNTFQHFISAVQTFQTCIQPFTWSVVVFYCLTLFFFHTQFHLCL